jgi:hypothetical protein
VNNEKAMQAETKCTGEDSGTTRRAFVKTASQIAVTAPAVGILLNATTKPASAQIISGVIDRAPHVLDDFTFGNSDEDIDGGPSLDDVT